MTTIDTFARCSCPVRFDNLTRQLYASDASLYQIEPLGVAFPQKIAQLCELITIAGENQVTLIPRGAGTGLAGGAVGAGLIVDLARYHKKIWGLDREQASIWVQAGVILDHLNADVHGQGLWFGPDVSTSSRATLGGMVAGNSSGAHAMIYGTTADHLLAVEGVLADGRIFRSDSEEAAALNQQIQALVAPHRQEIIRRFPAQIRKRWPGYGLDRYLASGNLAHLLCGSEGTLMTLTAMQLKLSPLPRERTLAVIAFADVAAAAEATVELLDLEPAAIELVDSPVFDQTRNQPQFRKAREMLGLDDRDCRALLMVEFFSDAAARMATLAQKRLGLRTFLFEDQAEMQAIWEMRKSGLTLLTGCPGPCKPVPGIEDAAVPVGKLPEYVRALQKLFASLQVDAAFYGHAGSGLLHVRPALDMHIATDIAKLKQIADEVSALVQHFQGSISGEHGVGIARTAYVEAHIGSELTQLTQAIKALFDPANIMNPGKIITNNRYRIDQDLRWGTDYRLDLPFAPVLAFAGKDHSFVGNLEQCNGCGGCLKEPPTMCPTYQVTSDEIMSTRGRSNIIRAVIDGRCHQGLSATELAEALDYCLACKGCQVECPSNVDMALLKAELEHARQRQYGIPLAARLISSVDTMGRIGCRTAPLANFMMARPWVRWLMEKLLGISSKRALPAYASLSFDRWFARQPKPSSAAPHGRVLLWDDSFTRYYEPHIGQAATRLLQALGYEVDLLSGHGYCGRPAFSVGRLDKAYQAGCRNIELLRQRGGSEPIIFLEPSSFSMFHDDYRELEVPFCEEIAPRAVLLEIFLDQALAEHPYAFAPVYSEIAVHIHCHAKKTTAMTMWQRLLRQLPQARVHYLDTGCCGMAGAFGMMAKKYSLSQQVAAPLIRQIEALPPQTAIVACGTSCRQQIKHFTTHEPLHIAQLFANALGDASATIG